MEHYTNCNTIKSCAMKIGPKKGLQSLNSMCSFKKTGKRQPENTWQTIRLTELHLKLQSSIDVQCMLHNLSSTQHNKMTMSSQETERDGTKLQAALLIVWKITSTLK